MLERISRKIAARGPGAAPKPAAKRTAGPAAARPTPHGEPAARTRIQLEWRPSVVWPGNLKPAPAAIGDGRIGVAWSASFN